jgi:hypothetical protein
VVTASLTGFEAFSVHDIVLSADTDDDGTLERGASATIDPTSFVDCNGNGEDDAIDLLNGTSPDVNGNGVPDECEATCSQPYCSRCYVCGDADASTNVDISDAVYLIQYIFQGGPEPIPLLAGDSDCSNGVDISDAVYLIQYIFQGGPVPCNGCK